MLQLVCSHSLILQVHSLTCVKKLRNIIHVHVTEKYKGSSYYTLLETVNLGYKVLLFQSIGAARIRILPSVLSS